MLLDTSTLYLVAAMVAAMLGAMLLFFGRQENIPALIWWGAAYLLGAASVALWTLASSRLAGMPSRLAQASHGDDDLSLGVSFSHVLESVGDFAQLVTPVDDRCHFSGLEKVLQDHHVRLVELRDEEDSLLAATHCRQP